MEHNSQRLRTQSASGTIYGGGGKEDDEEEEEKEKRRRRTSKRRKRNLVVHKINTGLESVNESTFSFQPQPNFGNHRVSEITNSTTGAC